MTNENRNAILRPMELKTYIEQNGGQTAFARTLDVSQGLVWQWLSGKTRITGERAIQIEEATRQAVTRAELRPDLFGPAEQAA